MEELELFTLRIPDFNNQSASQLIDFFAFFLQQICNQTAFSAVQIRECFEQLSLRPYSNISSYLSKNSRKNGKYIKLKNGYVLDRSTREKLAILVDEIILAPASVELVDISIFEYAPYYIKSTAKEMVHCYDNGLYNATLVLMRKLVETLIIECFERYGIDNEIKDNNGQFFYLSDLIPHYLASTKWNPSRNINKSMIKVKHYGDLSAHNRRYLAKKSDIDSFKVDLRQALQEIILTIDYLGWAKERN